MADHRKTSERVTGASKEATKPSMAVEQKPERTQADPRAAQEDQGASLIHQGPQDANPHEVQR